MSMLSIFLLLNRFIRVTGSRAADTGQLVTCLPCKHDKLSSSPHPHDSHKQLGTVRHTYHPSAEGKQGHAETDGSPDVSGLANLASP